MAQKSLSLLHRIDTSMVWTSFIHEKKYKWLSFNLWFFYLYFYKVFFFFNIDKLKSKNIYFRDFNTFIKNHNIKYLHIKNTYVRFSYHIDLYCIEFFNYIILLNLYFETSLFFYKKKKEI